MRFVHAAARDIAGVDRGLHGRRRQIDRPDRRRRRGRAHHRRARAARLVRRRLQTRNSCAKARRSRISSSPTGSLSASRTTARASVMREIYQPIEINGGPIVYTSRRSAEMIKYAANVFLAMKVTFINEIADLCETARRRRARRRPRHRPRQPHRPPVPQPRSRLRRLVLSQGHAGADQARDRGRSPMRLVETLVDVNDKRKMAMAGKIVARLRRFGRRASASPCSASPTSPTPTTCATRRAW